MLTNAKASPNTDLFLGFKCIPCPGWNNWVPEPRPPKNYTKQDTIDAWMEKAWVELQVRAAQMPLTGEVPEAAVLDHRGNSVVRGTGIEIYEWLCEYKNGFKTSGPPLRLWALDGRKLLHLCAMNAAKTGVLRESWGLYLNTFISLPQSVREVVEVWDPAYLLLGSEGDTAAKVASLEKFMRSKLMSISTRYDPDDPDDPDDPARQASFTLDIWREFGLSKSLL